MKHRNLLFLRSVLFGLGTKLAGAMTVFIGIPLISKSLPVTDYARFLQLMSAGSALTIFFSAAGAISTRYVAQNIDRDTTSHSHVDQSFGLFCLLATVFIIADSAALLLHKVDGLLFFTILLNALYGLFMWSDSYRVATRSDHLSSMFQLVGNSALIFLLVYLSKQGLLFITSAYFGIPLIIQLLVFIHIWAENKRLPVPTLSLSGLWEQARGLGAIVLNSGVEYMKIFGSGLAVKHVSGDTSYALYTTLILLVARLVNPLSLITRPLMPAFIDATRQRDLQWMKLLMAGLISVSIVALAGALGAAYLISALHLYRFLPGILGSVQPEVMIWIMLFFWGHTFTAFVLPIYVSTHRESTFSIINGIMVVTGISSGYLLLKAGVANAMLITIALSTFAASTILILTAVAALITLVKEWESDGSMEPVVKLKG